MLSRPALIRIVAADLRAGHLIHVMHLVLGAELPQSLLPAEEQQAGLRHLAVAHRAQRQPEVRIA
jgi:hypothetical protein